MKAGDKIILKDPIAFDCPFCGQSCEYGVLEPEDLDTVTHKMPACRQYLKLDGLEFLTACVKERKKNGPN